MRAAATNMTSHKAVRRQQTNLCYRDGGYRLLKPEEVVNSSKKIADKFRGLEFQERIHRLVDLYAHPYEGKSNPDVKRHIDLGMVRRLYMIQHSIVVLAKLPASGSEALPLHQVEEINVALNALYLNIRGILDNAAWALVHQLLLVENPNEQAAAHRRFTNLFGKKFLQVLAEKDKELAQRLDTLKDWGTHLARVRDPAAHRIPLYIPPSVLDESDVGRIAEIDRRMEDALQRQDWEAIHESMDERWNAGRFQQVLALSEQEGLRLVRLAGVLNRDLSGMFDALEVVTMYVFTHGRRPRATNCGPMPMRGD